MKICLLCVEIFAWGKYGGFGRATRTIGRELVKRGVEVHAVVPRRQDQKDIECLDGMTVHSFPPRVPWASLKTIRQIDADVYHSCEPSMTSYFAQCSAPGKKHVVTVRDPRDIHDWWLEFNKPSLSHLQVMGNYIFESNPMVRHAVVHADGVFATTPALVGKIERIYRGCRTPRFLPTPFEFPEKAQKASAPTVCYLARMDRRKRPELFLDLARQFPEVRFIAVGVSRDKAWDAALRKKYAHVPNLEMTGFIDQFTSNRVAEILAKSWIMVNTATREGLPNAFIEALASRCAILSSVNIDGLASRFGFNPAKDNFAEGLEHLLKDDRWRILGVAGYEWSRKRFDIQEAIDQHINVYEQLVQKD